MQYKIPRLAIVILIMFSFVGCSQKKEDKAFNVFNEGVTLSLESGQQAESGNVEKANELNAKAIDKYKETLTIDNSHKIARSALGHSYYMQRDFKDGIHWFEEANKLDTPMAANYRELGLCKINLGQIGEGKTDLEKAFEMDKGTEIKEITILDLVDIGHLAFEYGEGYETEGDKDKGLSYKRFSIEVLITAFDIDQTKKDIAKTISQYAYKIGDEPTTLKYKEIAEK
jgi:tetratricopeptide (TPR) repeat protein